MATIDADPYAWPYNGDLRAENTALTDRYANGFLWYRRLCRQHGV